MTTVEQAASSPARSFRRELPTVRAAVIQAESPFLDIDAGVEKACRLIEEARRGGARVIAFPETWLPGYPFWLWTERTISSGLFLDLFENAVEIPGRVTETLGEAARRAGAWTVIGVNERTTLVPGTLYNTQLFLAPDGSVALARRKVMPTHVERTVWGWGGAEGLRVLDTPAGRLGGLICWEHEMPLVRQALHEQGEQVHVAAWPAMRSQNKHIDFGCRQYAFEGACFVLVAGGLFDPARWEGRFGQQTGRAAANGGSAIIAPSGEYLAGPVYDAEVVLYADLDLRMCAQHKYWVDVAGHYHRPDLLRLDWPAGRPYEGGTRPEVEEPADEE